MVKYWILWKRAGPQSTLLIYLELLYFFRRSTKFLVGIEALICLTLLLGWIQKLKRVKYKNINIQWDIEVASQNVSSALAYVQYMLTSQEWQILKGWNWPFALCSC